MRTLQTRQTLPKTIYFITLTIIFTTKKNGMKMSRLIKDEEVVNFGGIIGGVIGIIGFIILSIFLLRKTFDRSTQESENIVLRRRRLQRHAVPYDRNIIRQQIESSIAAARTPEEEKERKEREAYIIDKLIHKASTASMNKLVDGLLPGSDNLFIPLSYN